MVISARFRDVDSFSENLARVRLRGKDGYIDRTGRFVIPPRFEGAGRFSNGRARIWSDLRVGYIDKTGRIRFKNVGVVEGIDTILADQIEELRK